MEFYKSIANYYDCIFPYDQVQSYFIESSIAERHKKKRILDIGCGTGLLLQKMSKSFFEVVGIDLNDKMIDLGKKRLHGINKNINFINLNMLKIKEYFSKKSFDLIYCFGNTLVHLDNIKQIRNFIFQTKYLLKPGGKLLLQIINYDYILKNSISSLPTIENEDIKFERLYRYDKNRNKIEFSTLLTIKQNGISIKNEVKLYPLLKIEIANILEQAEFNDIIYYCDFNKNELKDDSIALVLEASQ